MDWFSDIEDSVSELNGAVDKSQLICEALFNLLSGSELSLVLILYDCSDVETILERASIDESTYYRTMERIRGKLSPYLTDIGFLYPSDGECDDFTSGKEKDGLIGSES